MSDIFIKNAGQGSPGWRKASNIFVKTAGLNSTGWRSAVGVWIRNATQWLRVWPLSGIFATRVPYIGYFSSDTYENRMPNTTYPLVRIGDSYFGDNARWDLNGWAASSYTFRWKLYDQFGQELGITLRSGTGSGWTSTTGEDQLPASIWTSTNSTNADRQFLGFEVVANNSSNSQYNGLSVSTKIQIVREKPIISTGPTLSNTSPNVGSIINYSSGWNTSEAYKPEAGRTTIAWYRSTSNTLTESQLRSLTPIQTSGYSYTVVQADNANYIYAMEEVFNSGTDVESLVNGVTAIAKTTSLVATAPSAFTYSLTDISSVTTPPAPVQTRVSPTSNVVLIEIASSFPSDTESYELWSYGTGSAAGGTFANPSTQIVTTLNQYNSSGNFVPTGGSFDTITNISSAASNSPISTYTRAIGTLRTLRFNVSATTGAQSWRVNYTVSGASSGNGTFALNTNSMPATITIGGASNPTVTITGVIAYANLDQQGATTSGTAGSQTSISTIVKPGSFSTTSTSNYTFYTNFQATGSQRRLNLPSAFTPDTTIYVSTNGYINWSGGDPAGSTSIPTSGITVAPLAGDLRQGAVSASGSISTGGLWVFSDATNYYVTWWGNYYLDAAQVARYQVKFYWNQSYADIIIINNSLTTIIPSTTAVQNNANEYQNWSGSTAQASTQLSTASMNRISTQDGVDDNRTAIVASLPVVAPVNTVAPSATPSSLVANGSNSVSSTVGSWNNTPTSYSYQWRYLDQGTTYLPISGATSSTYTPPSNYVSLYGSSLRCYVTATNSAGSTIANSNTVTVNAQIIPTVTIAANSGVTQTAGAINWTSTNQASYSVDGTFAASGNPDASTRSVSKTGLTAGTTYTGTITVTSSTGNTATANYSLTTSAQTYSVTFDANGGTGAPATQTKTHGVNLTLSSTTPTRATVGSTQYTFAGWNTAANGTGTSYAAGATYTLNANLALFAQWTATTLNWVVTWNANGGTGGGTTTQPRGNSHTAPSPGTRSGFNFAHYRFPETGGTDPVFVASGGSYTPTANTTFGAIWTAVPVTPTVSTINASTTGRSGTSPNFVFANPKATFSFTFTNTTSCTIHLDNSSDGISWTLGVANNLAVSGNAITLSTSLPSGTTSTSGNFYYRARVNAWSGAGQTGNSTGIKTSSSVRNTTTPVNNASLTFA